MILVNLRGFVAIGLVALAGLTACTGEGCASGCAARPIAAPEPATGAGVFARDKVITNAASVRVTRHGLDFLGEEIGALATNLLGSSSSGAGPLKLAIPSSHIVIAAQGIELPVDLCPAGSAPPLCEVEIDLETAKLKIDPTASALTISGSLPLVVHDLPIVVTGTTDRVDLGVGAGRCIFEPTWSRPEVAPKTIPLEITIPIVENTDPSDARRGYTKIDVDHLTAKATLTRDDLHSCGQNCYDASAKTPDLATQTCRDSDDQLSTLLATYLSTNLDKLFKPLLRSRLCQNAPDGADTGSADAGVDSSPCVPITVGIERNLAIGELIRRFAPGNRAAFDVLVAAGGDLLTTTPSSGVTLSMLGGIAKPAPREEDDLPKLPMTCIPDRSPIPIPKDIALPDALRADAPPGWQAAPPHLGVAVSERFLRYAAASLYQQCVLSLGVTTESLPQIHSGVLSLLLPSVSKLTNDGQAASMAILTRPSKPPVITVGNGTDLATDPTLRIDLERFALDIFVWSTDRFVRAFTWTADVTIPANLQTGISPVNPKGGLMPVIGKVVVTKPEVESSELLFEEPAKIAEALATVLPGLAGQILGKIPPVDPSTLTASLGVAIDLPAGGIRKLTQGSDSYLGVFATLAVPPPASAPPPPSTPTPGTTASLLEKTVDKSAMSIEKLDPDRLPSLRAHLSSSRAAPVEFSYWIDDGTRSAWSPAEEVTIRSPYLLFQGKHTLNVVARERGKTLTEDVKPVAVPFVIDTLAPTVKVMEVSDGLRIDAWDFVSDKSALEARWRFLNREGDPVGSFTAWRSLPDSNLHPTRAHSAIEVEVRDEEGNVASSREAIRRGLDAKGSCACETAVGRRSPTLAVVGAAGLVLLLVARRLRRHQRYMIASCPIFLVVGCSGEDAGSGGDAPKTGCGSECREVCRPPLPMGLVGAYTSVATAPRDGTIWVAGYNGTAVHDNEVEYYGDLVVGRYDRSTGRVAWKTVDGLPPARTDGSCPAADGSGWRGGESDPGDDVGQWTSIQVAPDGVTPVVSYMDLTHRSLKMATLTNNEWRSHVVATPGPSRADEVGRYAKLLFVDGKPTIVFLALEKTRSKVVLATSRSQIPASPEDWTFEDVRVEENIPCRHGSCDDGEVCAPSVSTSCVPKTKGCEECGSGKACVAVANQPTCTDVLRDDPVAGFPRTDGAYISVATRGGRDLGVVLNDRLRGSLVGLSGTKANATAPWSWTTRVLDGDEQNRERALTFATFPQDMGVGASLAIDLRGDWHVSYAAGFIESLVYLHTAGPSTAKRESIVERAVIDSGVALGGEPFIDGKHRVGNDATISVAMDGTITIAYQDATTGALRVAVGSPAEGEPLVWSLRAIEQPKRFAGYFPAFVAEDRIANFWRSTNTTDRSMMGDVAFVSR